MVLDDEIEQHSGFLLDGRVQVHAVPGLVNLSDRTMERLVSLMAEQVAAPEFGLKTSDDLHCIVVSGVEDRHISSLENAGSIDFEHFCKAVVQYAETR